MTEIISKKRSSLHIFQWIGLIAAIGFNFYLVKRTNSDASFLWLAIGSFVFLTLPLALPFFAGYNKIVATEDEISFVNTLSGKTNRFTYSELTRFKSNIQFKRIGPAGGANAGTGYGVLDLAFGDFTISISEMEFENFQELKLFVHAKVK